MNIKYRQLKAFTLAARSLSFTQAAQALAVTQASFSSLIKELEADLGLSLFNRSTRRCELTPEGAQFFEGLQGPLEHLELLYAQMTEVGQGKRGRLIMSALPSMSSQFLPVVLSRFTAALPNVEVVLTERKNEDIFAAVKHRKVELGLGCLLHADPELTWLPLYSDHLMLLAPVTHELGRRTSVTWQDVARFPHIMIGTGTAEQAFISQGLPVQYAYKVEYVATAVAMVRQGLGLTTLPSSVLPTLNREGTVSVPIDSTLATRTLGVAHLSSATPTRVAQAFLQIMQDVASALPGAPPSKVH